MSAPALSVRRFTTTAHLPGVRPEEAGRVEAIARGVAAHRLERALTEAGLPPGIWCIRRLAVTVGLDLERPDTALEAAWAATLVGAVRHALATGSDGVVRYARERDAVADMVAGVVAGRLGRAWVWARLGLTGPGDPRPDRAPGPAVVALLSRRPELALGCVVEAARRAGVPAMHRALGPGGWAELAAIVSPTLLGDHQQTAQAALAGPVAPGRSPGPGSDAALAGSLAGGLVAASRLAGLVAASRLRPDPVTLGAWALLVVAEADPSVLRRQSAGAVIDATARLLTAATGTGPPASPPDPGAPSRPHGDPPDGPGPAARAPGDRTAPGRTATGPAGPSERDPARTGPAPADRDRPATPGPGGRAPGPAPETPATTTAPPVTAGGTASLTTAGTAGSAPGTAPAGGHPTAWAGLLFLLATAAEAGLPAAVTDDPVFAARALPWALTGVALALLPVAADDPAVAALAGLDPAGPSPWTSARPATAAERARIDAVAARWAAVTARALDPAGDDPAAGGDPAAVVVALARRRGRIDHSPGWVDVHLELDQVDVGVRRAGLDLDPGWVPWLGTVVRFIYG